jgi:predicted alpha/beta-fold hydrolase
MKDCRKLNTSRATGKEMNLLQDDRITVRVLIIQQVVMQKSLNIPTTDKKTIFGTIDTPKGKSKGLIIFVHGLTDNFNSHFLPNSAKYFTEK